MTANYDNTLDEPTDAEWCVCHESYRPCRACGNEAADRALNDRHERGRR